MLATSLPRDLDELESLCRVAGIASARPLAVRLSAEMLSAEFLARVPFEVEAGTVR